MPVHALYFIYFQINVLYEFFGPLLLPTPTSPAFVGILFFFFFESVDGERLISIVPSVNQMSQCLFYSNAKR